MTGPVPRSRPAGRSPLTRSRKSASLGSPGSVTTTGVGTPGILHDRLVSAPVTVVGAGISGVACARALQDAGVPVRVLDRGRRPGGRMATRTFADRLVDTGASYLTAEPGSAFAAVVDDWVGRGLARPWTDTFAVAGPDGLRSTTAGPVRYAAPAGLRSLVEDLATGLDVESGRTVAAVGPGRRVDGEDVPAVVLAMPDPQGRRLLDADAAGRLLDDRPGEPSLAVVLGWSERR